MPQLAYLEIEAKLRVADLEALRIRLDAMPAAQCTKPRLHEYNIRYEDAGNTLTPSGIVLRLRRDHPLDGGTDRVRLTYKAPTESAQVGLQTRFEAETEVQDFDAMHTILVRMGYHAAMVYEKYRTTYTLGGAELMLDEMPFGAFVEVEGRPDTIEAVIARLSLHDARRFDVGYAALFERVKARLDLAFNDLTFENFAAIDVPPCAFDISET